MTGLLFLISCRESGVCSAKEPLKSALEERLGVQCEDIRPSTVTHLHLSNYPEPISSASILSRFTSIKELRISDTQLSDISFVVRMPQLEVLHLDHSEVRDLSPLSSALNLKELWLDYTNVEDLSPLSKLTRLQVLTLRQSKIMNLAPLAKLKNLEVLDISNTSVFDIKEVQGATGLKAFSFRNTQVDNIEVLRDHNQLRILDMRKTRVSDLGPLSKLKGLTALDAGQSRIARLPSLPPVQELRLDGNPLVPDGCDLVSGTSKEECLQSMVPTQHPFLELCIRRDQLSFHQETTMESLFSVLGVHSCSELFSSLRGELDLRGEPILDLQMLEQLPLTSITVEQDWIWPEFCPKKSPNEAIQKVCSEVHSENEALIQANEIGFLKLCRETTDLEVRKTLDAMMDATHTQSCIRLWMSTTQKSELEVSRKGFTRLEPFAFFSNLRALLLDYNNIHDLSELASLPMLQILWIDDNHLVDVSVLRKNRNLLWIGLGDNEINDVSVLSSLPNIRRLWLGGNRISDISALSSLTKLRKLHLAGNQVRDLSPLTSLSELERLYLADNQISDVRPLSSLSKLQFLTVGLDYQESPLEAHHWLLRGNPIEHCPKEAPLPIQLACSFVE